MDQGQWEDAKARCFGMLLDGRAQPTGIKRRGDDATLLLVTNAHHDVVEFTLPEVPEGKRWFRLIDSNVTGGAETPAFEFGHRYQVTGRSLLVFVLGFEDRQPRKTREGIGAILDLAERTAGFTTGVDVETGQRVSLGQPASLPGRTMWVLELQ